MLALLSGRDQSRPVADASPDPSTDSGEPGYRIPSDEEVVAAVVRVILREGHVSSQRRLAELVSAALRRRNPHYRVGEARVRTLAVRSGLVGVTIHARHEGPDARRLDACPVCGSAVRRRANRTLAGGETRTGYRCSRCPWWTGRDFRGAGRYAFFPLLERGGSGGDEDQLTWRAARSQRETDALWGSRVDASETPRGAGKRKG